MRVKKLVAYITELSNLGAYVECFGRELSYVMNPVILPFVRDLAYLFVAWIELLRSPNPIIVLAAFGIYPSSTVDHGASHRCVRSGFRGCCVQDLQRTCG